MTDKQIIIDVCPYQGECSVSGCKRNDDGCFVRQLFEERNRAENQIVELNKKVEAKEQECEKLKREINSYVTITDECLRLDNKRLADEKKDLQQQLDQPKAEFEVEKNWHKIADEISKANSEYTRKLKQALIEIKEVANRIHSEVITENWQSLLAKQILQICDEVLSE